MADNPDKHKISHSPLATPTPGPTNNTFNNSWPGRIDNMPSPPNAAYPYPQSTQSNPLSPMPQGPFANPAQSPQNFNGANAPFPFNAGTNNTNSSTQPGTPSRNKKRRFERIRTKVSSLSLRGKILLMVLIAALLFPTVLIIVEGVNGYVLYSRARSGLAHLQAAQDVFKESDKAKSGNAGRYFDVNKLTVAQQEIDAAHNDFQSLRDSIEQDSILGLLGNVLPQQLGTARALANIGTDGTEIAQQFVKSAIKLAPDLGPALSNPLSGGSSGLTADGLKPYLTPAALDELYADLNSALPLVHDMNLHAKNVSLSALPLSDKQQQLLGSVLIVLPAAEVGLTQIKDAKSEVSWLLGVDQTRTFLIQTMDRAELRATGGFTGQFAELSLAGGHMNQLKFNNIGQYEEDHSGLPGGSPPVDRALYNRLQGKKAPAPYNVWWPIDNFGLRDANVSADYPTSAKIMMDAYQYDFQKPLDGMIIFTPFLISHVLHVTGPIHITDYNETITEQNLEDRLHFYQLDNAGILKEKLIEHNDNAEQVRKAFTQRVTKTLMEQVQHLPADKMLSLLTEMGTAMKTRDLQVYFTNPKVEDLVAKYGSTAAMDRSTDHDGLFIVQTNLSANKASQFVTTSVSDKITLDAAGNAKHDMLITLDYQKKGDVFGPDTYYDYVRIYTPTGSTLVSGNGFANYRKPFCGLSAGYPLCQKDVYGDGSLICETNPDPLDATNRLDDPYAGRNHPIFSTGEPMNQTSDETGRDMYAGWVVIPTNCTTKVSLSWTVPAKGKAPYSLLIQRQAGTFPKVDLTIQPAQNTCADSKDLHFNGVLGDTDKTFALNQSGGKCTLQVKS